MLASDLVRLDEQGRAAWPRLALDPQRFALHVERVAGGEEAARLHAGDLFLACACLEGVAGANAIFERQFLGDVGRFIAHIEKAPEFVDELQQVLREKLLVGRPPAPPKLASYSGRGALGGWVRVATVRTALNLLELRRDTPWRDDALASRLASPALDPEAELLHARARADFQAALEQALRELTAKERNLLRLHFVDGLNIEKIGVAYRVHRATIARWVAATREALIDRTRALLGERLRLTPGEVSSLTRLV